MSELFNENEAPAFIKHKVFNQLQEFSEFYEHLSDLTMGFLSTGTTAIFNLDTNTFTSISETLDSIKIVLTKGRVNDAYSLFRKYFDSTIINIYTNLYLEDNCTLENFIVTQIENWYKGKEQIPLFRTMSKYIKDSPKLKEITELLEKDQLYKSIRDRCNDHTHYNYYYNLLLNAGKNRLSEHSKVLYTLSQDLTAVFVQHFAYLFYFKDHYMMSTDYVDHLDCGLEPPDDSQYWVAAFVQEAFDKWIKLNRPDIADAIKTKTCMRLL